MKTAADIVTPDPACCAPDAPLGLLMVQHNCGEVPVVDADTPPIGVLTDRDIVARVLAVGKKPLEHTALGAPPHNAHQCDDHTGRRSRLAAAACQIPLRCGCTRGYPVRTPVLPLY
jgi:hypothetical protein